MDEDLTSCLDWDPVYLSVIFDQDFDDMNDLWSSNCVTNSEMLSVIESMEKYSPVVEDITIEDDVLLDAVERIEHE